MRFHIDEPVRWSDVDAAGVVYFGAFVRFFEVAEEELFRAAGVPYGILFDRFDCWLPRVKYSCEFRAPARLGEMMHVIARVRKIGEKSITLEFTIDRPDGVRVADCEIVLVCVDRTTWKGKPVPEGLRAALMPFSD
ncbi:MAG: acyl-CoA thioesterase [Candidatus Eremiobacteraeota bacterium]|nr:acyl-CoA thioesterase [Candidatus Eremiobacteraeota bacterium]